jgi:folate-binding protein YgfZ
MFWIRSARDVVSVTGPDAASYLQSQVSNDLRPMAVGDSQWSFVLQPTGKVDVLLRVWRTGDEQFVLDTDAGAGEVMIARLNRFKIRVKAEIEALQWECVAVRGDGAATAAERAQGVVAWADGFDLLGADVTPPADASVGTADQFLQARIDAAWPAMFSEIMPGETIPAETNIAAVAVSFTKGCYPGQELVERMDSRGSSAPRLLQRVTVPAGTTAGQPYLIDGVPSGVVTSVLGTSALAMVKRSALQG